MKKVIYIFISLLLISCTQNRYKPKISSIRYDDKATYESFDATIYLSDQHCVRARVYTKHLLSYHDIQKTYLKDTVNVIFYSEDGKKDFILTCKESEIDDITHDMIARKNVYAYNFEGVKITTDELIWNNNTRRFSSDKFVTVITPTEKIQGYGFESDSKIRNYIIRNIIYVTNSTTLSNE